MRRTAAFAVLAIAFVFASVAPAAADYGTPPPGGEGDAVVGSATPTDVNPGDNVTFNTGDALGDCTTADVFFVRGLQDATSQAIRVGAPVSGGSLSVQFAVPNVPAGIYFVYASCTDSAGNILQSVSVVVVFTAESPPGAGPAQVAPTQTGTGASPQAAAAAAPATPPAIAALQATPDAEQALLSDAAASGGQVAVISGRLAVSKRVPNEASVAKTSAPVVSGVLAVLAVMSLVVLRRRRRAAA